MRKLLRALPLRRTLVLLAAIFLVSLTHAQPTFPVNAISVEKPTTFAFTNATLVTNEKTTLTAATLLVKDGKILAAGTNISVPKNAMVIDCKGKYFTAMGYYQQVFNGKNNPETLFPQYRS